MAVSFFLFFAEKKIVSDIDLKIEPGKLHIVIGSVGMLARGRKQERDEAREERREEREEKE